MKKYEFLEHTADIKFRAYGKDIEKAFENAAYALTKIMINPSKVQNKVKKKILIKSEDKKALLYDFLEQFLILVDNKGFLLHEIIYLHIKKIKKGFLLIAEINGDRSISDYEVHMHIKAVTYQEMQIKKEMRHWMIQVVIDI